MKLRIDVTEEDIRLGVKEDTSWCPVALACKRVAPPEVFDLEVESRYVTFKMPKTVCMGPLPEVVHNFIFEFDRSFFVKPFSFDLEVQEEPDHG